MKRKNRTGRITQGKRLLAGFMGAFLFFANLDIQGWNAVYVSAAEQTETAAEETVNTEEADAEETVDTEEIGELQPVDYLDRYYNEESQTVVSEEETCESYTLITGETTVLHNGWYVVNRDIQTDGASLEVRGDVRIILEDGISWQVTGGTFHVTGANKLTIYGQKEDSGKLQMIRNYVSDGKAVIGGDGADSAEHGESCGSITFNGGQISVGSKDDGAIIGSGRYGTGGTITVNGGNVRAYTMDYKLHNSALIGSGTNGSDVTITINGGNVTAQAAQEVQGVNTTYIGRNTDHVTVNGGIATAEILWPKRYSDLVLFPDALVFNGGVLKDGYTKEMRVKNIREDLTVPEDYTINILPDDTIMIPEGITLQNQGVIRNNGKILNHGSIVNNGRILLGGSIEGDGSLEGNEPELPRKVQIVTQEHESAVSGSLEQEVFPGDAIEDVVVQAQEGYEFVRGEETAEQNGIRIIKNDITQVTVSGTLSSDVTEDTVIKLPELKESEPGKVLEISMDTVACWEKLPDTVSLDETYGTIKSVKYYLDGEELTDTVSDGYEYEIRIVAEPAEGTEFSRQTTAKINGKEAQITIGADGTAQITGIVPAVLETQLEYMDKSYDEDTKQLNTEEKYCSGYVRVTNGDWKDGWYVISKDTTLWSANVTGDVKLILKDGVTLTVSDHIEVGAGNRLTIYGQEKQTGKLIAKTQHRVNYPAIGSQNNNGAVVINGGDIEAHTYSTGSSGIGYNGTVTVNGGTVLAASAYGYDISGTKIVIHGGDIVTQNKGISGAVEQTGGIWDDTANKTLYAASELTKDITLASDYKMTVTEENSLIIPEGRTFENAGMLTVTGKLVNHGTLKNSGTLRIREPEQLSGNDITDEQGTYVQFMTADEIVVPTGLTYTGEDQMEQVRKIICLQPDTSIGTTVSGQTFVKDSDTEGWNCEIRRRGYVVEEVRAEGIYTVRYSKDGIVLEKDFAVGRFELTEDMMSGMEEVYYYTGKPVTPVPVITALGNTLENGWDYQVSYENNTEPGTAKMKVTGVTGCTGEFETTFEIRYPQMPEVTVSGTKGKLDYFTSVVSIRGEDCQVAEITDADIPVRKLDWKDELICEQDGSFTKTVRFKNRQGAVTETKEISFQMDHTAPAVRILAGKKTWEKDVSQEISQKHYRLDNRQITIEAEDPVSGLESVEYRIEKKILTEEELLDTAVEWTAYNTDSKPEVETDTDQIIYVRAEDQAGNIRYSCTDDIYIDTMAPAITGLEILTEDDALKEDQLTFRFQADGAGTYFYVVLPEEEMAPAVSDIRRTADPAETEGEILAGAAAAGTGEIAAADISDAGSVTVTQTVTGLTPDTSYKVYAVMQDTVYDLSQEEENTLAHNCSQLYESAPQRTLKPKEPDPGKDEETKPDDGNGTGTGTETKPDDGSGTGGNGSTDSDQSTGTGGNGSTGSNQSTGTGGNESTGSNQNTGTDGNGGTGSNQQMGMISEQADGCYRITGKYTAEYVSCGKTEKKKIVIPATATIHGNVYKVTSIAANACANNRTVQEITIGKNVKKTGNNAFAGCRSLKKITIGKNTEKIGKNVFKGCKKIKTVIVRSNRLTKKSLKKNSLQGIPAKAVIRVPKKKVKTYRKLFFNAGINRKVKILKGK